MTSHWVACQLFSNEVHFYDSADSTVSAETLDVLAQLIRTDQKIFTVKVVNTSKQAGSVDCVLYAMATLAYLAFGKDPTTIVINQDDMRPHLVEIFEKKIISISVSFELSCCNRLLLALFFCWNRLPISQTVTFEVTLSGN